MPDPNSFGGKLALSAIDKLVFALLLALIAADWKSDREKIDRQLAEADRITGIEIQKPVFLLEELSKPVRDCIALVRGKSVEGITDPEDVKSLQSLILQIEILVELIEVYVQKEPSDQDTGDPGQDLMDLVQTFNRDVTGGSLDFEQYTQFEQDLKDRFIALSKWVFDEVDERIRNADNA